MSDITEKKKRGRKPKSEKENKQVQNDTDNTDPQLLHLNITRNQSAESSAEFQNENEMFETDYCNYKPELLVPNAYNDNDTFSSKPFELSSVSSKESSHSTNSNVKIILKHIEKHQLTNVACYWCCHRFENTYLGLPIKYKNNTFEVYGCFCSFECMCAYNFYSNETSNNTWEIYNLINIMAKSMHYDKYVYPAPPRKCLTMFGGYMSIDEFRNFKNSNKIINANKSPFVVVVDQIEEINDFNHKQQQDILLNFDKERISNLENKLNRQQEELLQNNYRNTLNATMNIS
tara:strand:- start:261 stop:1127 length:867 start_codon:yes stop_codon:yes gene_type:complete